MNYKVTLNGDVYKRQGFSGVMPDALLAQLL